MVKVRKSLKDIVFGRLTVITQVEDHIESNGRHNPKWLCQCECGDQVEVVSASLKKGLTKSCGCLWLERVTKHGLRHHPLYKRWENMKTRCYNKDHISYKDYGSRNITICNEWINSPDIFIKWGLTNGYKKELDIDRRDNDKGYSPSNCRFVTRQVNSLNKRTRKNNTSGYTGIRIDNNKWQSFIMQDYKYIYLGLYATKKEALRTRNNYIEAHGLLHKLQKYIGE